jgi:superfamily II DNA or RNA helicase
MLPQPRLRFLLADEPGTGKTIMAGLYMREMRSLGLVNRALVVAPAGLVSKWQADFDRFFGGGLRRITAGTVHEHALDLDHDVWVVSLELAAMNPVVQEAIRPDRAGWDLVVFDEAHRLTATAQSFHRVGRLLSVGSPRVLLMTATPHRGSEWLFRHLLHLVDSEVYLDPGDDPDQELSALRPGSIHFLRRMKEDLVDYDGVTPLFKRRHATNHRVPLSAAELGIYEQALDIVDRFFPPQARPLARMVYGKRAASSLHAIGQTLSRRLENMGQKSAAQAAADVDPEGEDLAGRDEAQVIYADSASPRAEKALVRDLLVEISGILQDPGYVSSKWRTLIDQCLLPYGIEPAGREQAVIFTEYADSAEWITERLIADGYSARTYSGRRSHAERNQVRAEFMAGDFQIIVSTDAGNEGIDLQAAHVLVNFDIPWSLVRLEQRMGRIHRVGQTRDVELFNLVAADTREGDTLHTLLENFVTAANELNGQMFDSLSLVAELAALPYEQWLQTLYGDDELKKAEVLTAVRKVSTVDLKRKAEETRVQEAKLASSVDVTAGLARLHEDSLEQLNPEVVEAYLRRLDAAGVLRVQNTAAGEGILLISSDQPLPMVLGGGHQALAATSGTAMLASADVSRVVPLGPGTPAFVGLVAITSETLTPDIYRGGAVEDPSAASGYELYAFESAVSVPAEHGDTPWSALVRVDANGQTRQVHWETLANLVPTVEPGNPPDEVRIEVAASEARRLLVEAVGEQRHVRRSWFSSARRDLTNLPIDLTADLSDRAERIRLRDQLAKSTERRLGELEALCNVEAQRPRLVARLQVLPGRQVVPPEQVQADVIAARNVRGLLVGGGWAVKDVRPEGRGYDFRAVRGQDQRLVAAKGIWRSVADSGVRLRGDEQLMAAQHRRGYWLHVVDRCHDGSGILLGSFRDPITTFNLRVEDEAIVHIPGSAILAALASDQETP